MFIRTKYFGFMSGRDYWSGPPMWFRRFLRIGFGHAVEYGQDTYALTIALDFWLIPNFIWYRTAIHQQCDRVEFQDRIIGIQSWPFSLWHRFA